VSSVDFPGARWRKSSYSNGQANCIEVTPDGERRTIAVRDSKATDGPKLIFAAPAWRQFTGKLSITKL
jgi:hypothetical protein